MSVYSNKVLVLQFLSLYAAARYEEALDLLREDCIWWLAGHPHEFPAAGAANKATVRRRLAKTLSLLPDGIKITTGAITAEDDRVAIEAESKGTTLHGREYHNRYHFLFLVRENKITLVKEYLDTLHARETLGGAAAATVVGIS